MNNMDYNDDYSLVEKINDEDIEANLMSDDVQLKVNTILHILDTPNNNKAQEKKHLLRHPNVRWVVELIRCGNVDAENSKNENPNAEYNLRKSALSIPEHLYKKCFYFSDYKQDTNVDSAIKKVFKHSEKYDYYPSFKSINLVDDKQRFFVKANDGLWYLLTEEDFNKFFKPIEEHRKDLIKNLFESDTQA